MSMYFLFLNKFSSLVFSLSERMNWFREFILFFVMVLIFFCVLLFILCCVIFVVFKSFVFICCYVYGIVVFVC